MQMRMATFGHNTTLWSSIVLHLCPFVNVYFVFCREFSRFFCVLFPKAWAKKLQIAVCRVVCWLLRRGSANRFSRGEAVAKIGYSEPILVTEVECGQECIVMVSLSGLAKGNALVGLYPVPQCRLSPAFHFRPSVRTGAPSPREKGWPPPAANSPTNSNLPKLSIIYFCFFFSPKQISACHRRTSVL